MSLVCMELEDFVGLLKTLQTSKKEQLPALYNEFRAGNYMNELQLLSLFREKDKEFGTTVEAVEVLGTVNSIVGDLYKVFGVQKIIDLHNKYKLDLFPSLIYNRKETDIKKRFNDFSSNGTNTKLKEYRDNLKPNISEVTMNLLMKQLQEEDAKKITDRNYKSIVNNLPGLTDVEKDNVLEYVYFDRLVKAMFDGQIVNEKGQYKLKFESGLAQGLFRDDDSIADGTKEVVKFAKVFFGALKSEATGKYINHTTIQSNYGKLQNHPLYYFVDKFDNKYQKIKELLDIIKADDLKKGKLIKEFLKGYDERLVDKLAIRSKFFKINNEPAFVAETKEVIDFLKQFETDITNLDGNLKGLYTNLHTALFNSLTTVTNQNYSVIRKSQNVWKIEDTGEIKDTYELEFIEALKTKKEIYTDLTIGNLVKEDSKTDYDKIKSSTFDELFTTNNKILSAWFNLGNLMKNPEAFDYAANVVGFTQQDKNEIADKLSDLINDVIKNNDISLAESVKKLIKIKAIIEVNTPTSTAKNVSGDSVPRITLMSNIYKVPQLLTEALSVNYDMYKNNVLNKFNFELLVAGGIDNGKDITEYKKLSLESQIKHDIEYRFKLNKDKNNKIDFLPYEYSDKSRNIYIRTDYTALGNSEEDVTKTFWNSQVSFYNGQLNGFLKQVKQMFPGKYDAVVLLQDNVEDSLATNLATIQSIYDDINLNPENIRFDVLNSELIKADKNTIPLYEGFNYSYKSNKFMLKDTYVKELKAMSNLKDFSYLLKTQIVKDIAYLDEIGYEFDDNSPLYTVNNKNIDIIVRAKRGAELSKEDVDAIYPTLNKLYKDFATRWQTMSVNMTQLTEGSIYQYKGDTITSMWLDSTKRNVFPLANGQAFTFGLYNGIEKQSYTATIEDPTENLFNVLGLVKDQDSEDGSDIITEEQLEKMRNSVGRKVGNEIGDVLKTINQGFDFAMGLVKKDKKADHTILGEKVRSSEKILKFLSKAYNSIKYLGTETVTIPPHYYAVREVKNGKLSWKVEFNKGREGKNALQANSLFDIRQAFGSGQMLGYDVVIEDPNGDIEFNNKTYRFANSRDDGSSTQIIINQILPKFNNQENKGRFLGQFTLKSARKVGVTNLNKSDVFEDDTPFKVSLQDNTSRFIQLNAYHEIDDHADITVASQITGASTFNAHVKANQDNAKRVYESYRDLIEFQLSQEIPDLSEAEKGIFTDKFLQFVREQLTDKATDLDVINLKRQLLDYFNTDEELRQVIQSNMLSNQVTSLFGSMLSDMIQFKLDGFQAVMGVNFTEVYRDAEGNIYNYQDAKALSESGVQLEKSKLKAQ